MAYAVPFNSSPPSTPDNNRAAESRGSNTFGIAGSTASTTPSGPPPPSSARSFTPAGPPPSSAFGSSQLGSRKSLFGSQANGSAAAPSPFFASTTGPSDPKGSGEAGVSGTKAGSGRKPRTRDDQPYEVSRPPLNLARNGKGEAGTHNAIPTTQPIGLPDQDTEMDSVVDGQRTDSRTSGAMSLYDWAQHGASTRSTAGSKARRSKRGSRGAADRARHSNTALYSNPGSRARLKPSVLPTLARSAATQLGTADLLEPHSLIMQTEQEIRRIYPEGGDLQDENELLDAALQIVPEILARAWQKCCKNEETQTDDDGEINVRVGPSDDLPQYHKASFIASLLLSLYHPPSAQGKQVIPAFRSSRLALAQSLRLDDISREQAYPKLLFDWLHENHNPYAEVMRTLDVYKPNATAHPTFWDLMLSFTLRGRLVEVARVLTEANFQYAHSAADDGFGGNGYPPNILNLIDREVQRTIQTLMACPGVTEDDWDLRSFAWAEYRERVEDSLKQLVATSERVGTEATAFDASKITLRSSVSEFNKSTKQTDVKMPRIILRSLKDLYTVLLGRTTHLLAAAMDWVEATVALTAWWDGEDDDGDDFLHSLTINQSSRLVDIDPGAAYRRRLAAAFERVTGMGDGRGDTFQIDSNSPVEIALGSVFENNLDGVLLLLKGFSLPIASAVLEIGAQARWYQSPRTEENAAELDNSDMMVLSYGQTDKPLSRNELLSIYADHLFDIRILEWHGESKEGWELAVEMLGRIDNIAMAAAKIGELMDQINVDSDQRADKLIDFCQRFGLHAEGKKVSEKYADHVVQISDRYGTALIYYARAQSTKKVQDVLALLISYCLVQSTAFPAIDDLDPHLSNLLQKPRESLLWLASKDPQAAEILSITMSGYATLRRFYDIRDESVDGKPLPLSRQRAAAAALVVLISSASSSIQGGIFDPENDSVVPFSVLLVLLGEAMPFVDRRIRCLSLRQIMVLLRAIEDVQTVDDRIRAKCDECLKSTLAACYGVLRLSDPQEMLKKSVSGLTASSGFSIIAGSLESDSSGKLNLQSAIDQRRGWDWRRGIQSGSGADEIIKILRLGLARDVSKAWLDGEELQ